MNATGKHKSGFYKEMQKCLMERKPDDMVMTSRTVPDAAAHHAAKLEEVPIT